MTSPWATSRSSRDADAEIEPLSKSTMDAMPSPTNTCSPSSAPCATRESRRRRTSSQRAATPASRAGPGSTSASAGSSGWSSASSAADGPATPAATITGTLTPASRAAYRHTASCSTCCRRVMVSVGPESLYARNRHALATSRVSAASRPYTRTRSGSSSGRLATTTVDPLGCSCASTTDVVTTPSSASAAATCAMVGRPAGDPSATWRTAAIPQPTASAPTTASIPPRPSTIVPGTTTSSTSWPSRRTGRVRNGLATNTTAASTASRTVG